MVTNSFVIPADIQTILPSTFHDLGESLNHIEDATTRLKDHYTQHDIPNNKYQQLDDIIVSRILLAD